MTSIPLSMATVEEYGEVKIPFIQYIEWRIPDYFEVAKARKHLCIASSTFPVAGELWHLRLWPGLGQLFLACNEYDDDSYYEFVRDDDLREYDLEYYFGLKKRNGAVEHLHSGIVKAYEVKNSDNYKFVRQSCLLDLKSELVPENVLTIVCTIKWMPEVSQISTQPETVLDNKTKSLKLIRLDKLSENFKTLFCDKETCDVILKVQDKEYKAHRSVLMARSSVFAANFKHDTLERQTGVITIPDCDPDSFQVFLDYLYSGKLEELSFSNALNLYHTSNKYDVEELKAFCVEYMIQCMTVENVCEIAVLADLHDETQLYKAVQEFFNKNSLEIFLIPEWEHLLKKSYRLARKLLAEMSKMKLKK